MAVILGNFNENKKLKEIKENVAHNFKLQTIKELISELEPQVKLAQDIYDTYHHISKIDGEFANRLWTLLCRNKVNGISINSYFSWEIGYENYVLLSRHGVGVDKQYYREKIMERFGLSQEDVYRGKASLEVFLEKFDISDEILDKIIEELQVFLTSFKKYADDFFSSVSAYNVRDID